MAEQDYNAAAHQNAINEATANANEAYNQGMLAYHNADLAFRKAQQAWTETMDKSGLTGKYEGQYTMPSQQWFAQQFGTWGAPTQGQQTLTGQQQQWKQAFDTAAQYGQYYGMGQGPAAGTKTQQQIEQEYAQGLRTQQEQRAAQAQQQAQAQEYLKLLASLRGPADWAKYQQVLGAGGSMNSLAAAAMGQYVPGGGATTGYQPQAASLQSMMGQIGGQPYQGQGGGQLNMPNVYGQNTQAMYAQQPQQTAAQQTYAQLQGQTNPQAAAGQRYGPVSGTGQQAANPEQMYMQQMQNAQGNGTNMMGAQQPGQYQPMNLPAPNQIAPQAWGNFTPSQKEVMLGEYEAQGWHKPDVEALFNQSMPKYGANAPTAGTFRLR